MEDMAFFSFRFTCSLEGVDLPITRGLLRTGTGGMALYTTGVTGKAFGRTRRCAPRRTFHAAEWSGVLHGDDGNW